MTQKLQVHGQEMSIGTLELIGGLLDYAERFADLNSERADGDCRSLIRLGQAWFESGSATIDIDDVGARLAEYVTRFADKSGEPDGGNCRRVLSCASAKFGSRQSGQGDPKAVDSANIERFRVLAAAIGNSSRVLRAFARQDNSQGRCLAEVAHQRAWYEFTVLVRDSYPWQEGPEFDARAQNAVEAGKSLERTIQVAEGLYPGILKTQQNTERA